MRLTFPKKVRLNLKVRLSMTVESPSVHKLLPCLAAEQRKQKLLNWEQSCLVPTEELETAVNCQGRI